MNIFAVVVLVRTSKGTLLVSRRNRPDNFGLPGGKVDEGELPIRAARRELKEETGIDGFDFRLIYFLPEPSCGNRLVAVYSCLVDVDQNIQPEDGLNVIWGDIELTAQDDSVFRDFNRQLIDYLRSR